MLCENNYERNIDEYLKEIKSQISEQKFILIGKIITSIYDHYNSEINLLKTESEIKNKIEALKLHKKDDEFYIKIIAFIIKVCELKFKIKPRKIQILSLILFIYKEKNEGIIEQILTGEGKSLIISFLALIKAFSGYKVDILTSSPILAERDANKMKDFYNFFDISVDYGRETKSDETGKYFSYYKADICYSDALTFEGDILRTEFLGNIGRGNKRGFDCIIVDEIDNICLDNIKNMTELTDSFRGYKYLEYCYLVIFNELKQIDKKFIGLNSEEKKKRKKEIVEELYTNVSDKFNNIPSCIKIQKYMKEEFINYKVKKWCESAFDALFFYKRDKDYIITVDKELDFNVIKPIDFANTGIIEENTIWSGLHQFLQIKEQLRLTEENLNSCYMSNLSFFKRYIKYKNNEDFNSEIIENNIYGLTGTLGSEKSQNALKRIYNLNLIFIPSFKKNKLIIEKPLCFNYYYDHKEELKKIIKKIAIEEKRAVLVILRYIDNVKKLKLFLLQDNILKDNIITYTRSDIYCEKKFLNEEIKPGCIILSTNLSGRGTDIKICKEVEKNGGLHVILTFIPRSERIERQAFGRAARKGEKGSAQYVICSSQNIDILLEKRNIFEMNEYKYLIEIYQKKIFLFEKLFKKFSEKLNAIRNKPIKNEDDKELIIEDIKERWSLFLVQNDLSQIDKNYKDEESLKYDEKQFKKTEENFNDFIKRIENDTISLNKYCFLNKLLKLDLIDNDCKDVISISPIGAYINIIINEIFNKTKNYKKTIEKYFKKIKKECSNLKNQIKFISNNIPNVTVNESKDTTKTDLQKQFKDKLKFITKIYDITEKNLETLVNNKNKRIIPKIYDVSEEEEFTKDIYQYYNEFGMIFFTLQIKEDEEEEGFLSSIIKLFR